eukprot:Nk52_evm59s221 gene=Nk52_evmTU59s221
MPGESMSRNCKGGAAGSSSDGRSRKVIDAELLEKFPLIIPENCSCTAFGGYIKVQGTEYRIRLQLPKDSQADSAPALTGSTLECDLELQLLLSGYEELVRQRLTQCSSISAFLVELCELIERTPKKNTQGMLSSHQRYHPKFYEKVISAIDCIGSEHVSELTFDPPKIVLCKKDGKQRSHFLQVFLTENFPEKEPKVTHSLPGQFFLKNWAEKGFKGVFDMFSEHVELYQSFWDITTDIDENCRVIEPENPDKSCNFRRIILTKSVTLLITVNPSRPDQFPEFRLVGTEKSTKRLGCAMQKNFKVWALNADLPFSEKLKLLFELETLPVKANKNAINSNVDDGEEEDFCVDCGICYSFRLGDETPSRVCEYNACARAFHPTCLYQWLKALPNGRQSFNTIFGECPYCSKQISVKASIGS